VSLGIDLIPAVGGMLTAIGGRALWGGSALPYWPYQDGAEHARNA
jgi:hypothetical protein